MKNLVVTGVLGLAAVSAYFIFQSGDDAPKLIIPDAAPAVAPSDLRAKITQVDEVRTVEASEAQNALKQIGLWEPSDTVSWDTRKGESGNYTFTNFSVTRDGDQMQVANLEVSGLRLLDGNKAYYDAVSASKVKVNAPGDNTVITIDAMGMKMPDGETVKDSLSAVQKDDTVSPMDHLMRLMEPGQLPTMPEAFVENVRIVKQDEVRFYTASEALVDMENGKMPDLETKKVEEVTTLGFAALSKIDGTDDYSFQASNFSGQSHDYKGVARQTDMISIQVSGFKGDVMDRFEPGRASMMGANGSDLFSPWVQSATVQGFKTETDMDLVQVDQASLWHSDTQSDQFTRKIDVPNILIETKPQYQTNAQKQRWSDNPFAEIGYDKINMSVSSQTSFDKQAKTLTEEATRISASDAFDMSLSYKVGNIDTLKALFMGRYMGNENNDQAPTISFIDAAFTDRGMIDRIHEKLAADKNMTVAEVKETTKAASLAMKMGAQTDYQRALMQSAIDAYSALIDTGGKFRLSVQPQRPIDMGEFGKVFRNGPAAPGNDGEGVQDYERSMQMDALDALIREVNISFEHYIAD